MTTMTRQLAEDAALDCARDLIAAIERDEPPTYLLELTTDLRSRLDGLDQELVRDARAAGTSWERIGLALSVSKQAAQQRYGT